MAIQTRANFAHPRHRGYRVPNGYSAKSEDDLRQLSTNEGITVHNARELYPAPTIETHGFQLVKAPTKVNLMDTDAVTELYYPECKELLKEVTGAENVVGGGHEYRTGITGEVGRRAIKPTPNGSGGGYAGGIHSDMCSLVEKAFSRRVPEGRHFQSINIWRSCKPGELVQMMPLAVCDINSVVPEDIVFGDGQNTGNIKQYTKVVDQRVIYSPQQRWYYFPDMTYDEVLLFRQYDTRQEELNMRTVFHTAVWDPATTDDTPMRWTIEIRMQAIHGMDHDRDARRERFLGQITDTYLDGSKCDWWHGPIERYKPPPGVA